MRYLMIAAYELAADVIITHKRARGGPFDKRRRSRFACPSYVPYTRVATFHVVLVVASLGPRRSIELTD